MQVIGVLNTKGGVGKSTLAAALAVRAASDGRVGIVDLDPQATTAEWYVRRGSPENPELLRNVDRASDAVERLLLNSALHFVILDGPPGSLLVTEDAIKSSSLVLVPVKASGLDLAASRDCIEMCGEMGKRLLVVINDKGQHDGKLVDQALALLATWKVPVARTVVAHRTQYVNAMTSGRTGAEKDQKAREEIDALWLEVRAALKKAGRA